MHQPSNSISGGVKMNQDEVKPQQEADSWNPQPAQDDGAASSNPVPSTSNATKKKGRSGYWKEVKARKKAQAAAESDMNENGGVATSIPVENNETHTYGENGNFSTGENTDAYTLLPSVEAPAPLFSPEIKPKSKNGKKAKGASHVAPEQEKWQSSISFNDNSGAEGGWDASVTQKVWDIENRNERAHETGNGIDQVLEEVVKAKKPKQKKKKAKPTATAESETGNEGFDSGYKAGNVNVATGSNADPISGKRELGGTTAVQEMPPQQSNEIKETKKAKKKKAKKNKTNAQGEPGTPDIDQGDGAVDKAGQDTPTSSVAGADSNGDSNGPAPSAAGENKDRTPNDEMNTNGIENKGENKEHDVNGTQTRNEIPMPSAFKEQKPKQMKIQVDLDLELAAVLKAKVKGEMMITFM
ncbi:uncharacterized protein GIQ15_06910 [Arthroderma uncinatum]|uniref:uncharacterized protein n=1 Tax=Arthroderma uncinatum TaxID=74035 RepID=UPI00144A52F7|nr:uncharacterized protein GIQ15_06910 [Arthroderma uncinatum]KAF3479934.1 hypothetical protein GIQ15_06910 [Arthroderma uncinatum]